MKKNPRPAPSAARMVEDIVGCKWSLTVLGLVQAGVHRPGRMLKKVPGLSTKVLNERLKKLLRYGIVERMVFAEVPPHVEYRLTEFGGRIGDVLDRIAALDREWGTSPVPTARRPAKPRAAAPARARSAPVRRDRRKSGGRKS